jgi:hypothetical protein
MDFSLCHHVQIFSEAFPASFSIDRFTRSSLHDEKRSECEIDRSSSSRAEVGDYFYSGEGMGLFLSHRKLEGLAKKIQFFKHCYSNRHQIACSKTAEGLHPRLPRGSKTTVQRC